MDTLEEFGSAIEEGSLTLGVEVSKEALLQLKVYQQVLARWAPKVNLVADPDPSLTAGVHFLDSIALDRILNERKEGLTDIGTGAGFPGLVQAILHPDRQVTLIEPIGKRASFLQQVLIATRIRNCTVEIARTSQSNLQPGRILIARAVFPPKQWLTEAARLLDGEGWVVLMTSTPPGAELTKTAESLGLEQIRCDAFELPVAEAPRVNTLFRMGGP